MLPALNGAFGFRLRSNTGIVPVMTVEVIDNPDRGRFEARVDGELAGFTEYEKRESFTVMPHTEVDDAFRGQGVAGTLVRAALDEYRASGQKVKPLCPYVRDWIGRHPEYDDVVYQA